MLESRWQKSYERRTLTSQLTPTRRKRWYRGMIKHMLVSQEGSAHLTKMTGKTSISGGYTYILCISSCVTLKISRKATFNPVQTRNVWRSNIMNYSMLTTHFRVWTICLMVFNKIWTTSNFWSYVVKLCDTTQYNIITFGHWTMFDPRCLGQTFLVWTVPDHHLEALFVFVKRTQLYETWPNKFRN